MSRVTMQTNNCFLILFSYSLDIFCIFIYAVFQRSALTFNLNVNFFYNVTLSKYISANADLNVLLLNIKS